MQKVTGEQFANNAVWKFFELIIRKSIGLVISTILARLLMPEAYGIVALTTVFITFSDIFIQNGFNIALVRKGEISEDDYSTVMILSLLFTTGLYLIFFFSAPTVAIFYNTPELKIVLRVLTISLFFRAIASVIRAKGTRELKFREMSIVTVVENIMAGIIGLFFAYRGFGVWALIAQQMSAAFLDLILLSFAFHWKYRITFRIAIVKEMFSFTIGVLGSSFMDFLGSNVNSLVVGKAYSSVELGYMNRGNMYPEVIGLNTYNAINSVLLPTLASRQNDRQALRNVVRKVTSLTEYILVPMMIGLIGISRNFIAVFLTEKWMPCRLILICSCLNYLINPVRTIGANVFYALGESRITLKIEIIRVISVLINLFVTIVMLKKSIYTLAFINLMILFLIAFITQIYVRKLIGYTFKEFFSDIFPSILLSIPILIVTFEIERVMDNNIIKLLLQIVLGSGIYLAGSMLTKNKNFSKLIDFVSRRLRKQ